MWRTGTPVAVLVGVWEVLAATRITRGEEDTDRWDLPLIGIARSGLDVARPDYVRLCLPFVGTYGDGGLGLLGDPTRRAIFELLARRACSVGELADQLPISRPAVSQHLKVLKDGGLVVSRAEGTRRIYHIDPEGVTALRTWLDGVWSDALAGFHKIAETTENPDPGQETP